MYTDYEKEKGEILEVHMGENLHGFLFIANIHFSLTKVIISSDITVHFTVPKMTILTYENFLLKKT